MAKNLWVGTSGYSYKHWRDGVFYPPELPEREWFEYYQQHFSTVELNVTFYRLPTQAVFKSWYKRADRNFRFFVKGSRYITHIKRLKDPMKSLRIFYKAVAPLKDKMAGVLWQLPPKYKENLERLEIFLKALKKFEQVPQVFEFRDESWFTEETTALLHEAGAVICRADGREFYLHREIPDTGPIVYFRRHGPKWLQPFKHSYPDHAIARDAEEIRHWLKRKKEVYMYYNNDGGGAAPKDAKRLVARVREGVEQRRAA